MKRHAPATERNREPILQVLKAVLPASGTVLEIASGSGQHAVFFAQALPHLRWQPTDLDRENLASIQAWAEEARLSNLLPPLTLDAASAQWPSIEGLAAIVCINMIHISPWPAAEGLMSGAGQRLPVGAPLVLYGPFFRHGVTAAPSNIAFDESLKARDPSWGVRRLEDVADLAKRAGLSLDRVVEMPSNNCSVVFRKS